MHYGDFTCFVPYSFICCLPAVYRNMKIALDMSLLQAKGAAELTAAMVKEKAQCDASQRLILKASHSNSIWFRNLREKLFLTNGGRGG